MTMKRFYLFLFAVLTAGLSQAAVERPMLAQSKTWVYVHHHFEDNDPSQESQYMTWYWLKGDTVIDGREYMKMYRRDDMSFQTYYYGAFREEDGKVYMYDFCGDKQDFKLIDFSLDYEDNWYGELETIVSTINVNGQSFCRYQYRATNSNGEQYMTDIVGVEGVGFRGAGVVGFVFEPQVDCICDYEEFMAVYGSDMYFTAADFDHPKQIELSDTERGLVKKNNDFAFNLFRQARTGESLILSPLSITMALGMLNNAAAGQTLAEINQTLGFEEGGADAINAFCRKMLDESALVDPQTRVLLANTIFVNEGQGFFLQPEFVEKAATWYDASLEARDFADGQTLDVINQWASDHTEGMVKEVLTENEFKPYEVSYMLNALYFKGCWSSPFAPEKTSREPFGSNDAVDMMWKPFAMFSYADNDCFQSVILPYGNTAYNMTVMLPHEDKTIEDVLASLNGDKWPLHGEEYEVDLKLPRFETTTNQDLKEIMSALGMPSAFDKNNADFPYFCNWPVFIELMKQVAKIQVDEKGTEAAAVTIIGNGATSMPSTAEFHANRPFLYVISEQSTGIIFFIGQYMGNIPAGIKNPLTQTSPREGIFTLTGQRLSSPPAQGVYIQDGKLLLKR